MRLANRMMGGALGLALGALACGTARETTKAATVVPVESTTAAAAPATGKTAGRRVLFLGTSLTAGLGVDPDSAYPMVVQRLARDAGYDVEVINGGLSGETSAGALRRADWLLSQPIDVLVIETGANDGLRGLDPDTTAANIEGIIAKARRAHPTALIAITQMEAPPNLGPRYTRRFHLIFPGVAKRTGVRLLPFLLDGVAGKREFNQDDGIHPTPEGARRVGANVWTALKPLLDAGPR